VVGAAAATAEAATATEPDAAPVLNLMSLARQLWPFLRQDALVRSPTP
jgi:hypothetical protein